MRRRVGLFLFCGLVLPLVASASASAQGAVLRVSQQVVKPGDLITIEGAFFSSTLVNIRIGPTRDSEIVRETEGPSFAVDVEVPPLAPGWHLIQATQVTAAGRHRGFTPGRSRILVRAAAGAAGLPAAGGPTDAGPPTPLVVTMIGLFLLAGTSALTVRKLRTLNRPLGN